MLNLGITIPECHIIQSTRHGFEGEGQIAVDVTTDEHGVALTQDESLCERHGNLYRFCFLRFCVLISECKFYFTEVSIQQGVFITRLQVRRPKNWGSSPTEGKNLFSPTQLRDRAWGLPTVLGK
jgi:hypothetical protein